MHGTCKLMCFQSSIVTSIIPREKIIKVFFEVTVKTVVNLASELP